jgi:hypothetical protein
MTVTKGMTVTFMRGFEMMNKANNVHSEMSKLDLSLTSRKSGRGLNLPCSGCLDVYYAVTNRVICAR